MTETINILLVEDCQEDADILTRFLRKASLPYTLKRVWDELSYLSTLQHEKVDLVISDNSLPQFSGIEACRIVKKLFNHIPFIMLTGTVMEHTLTEYQNEGMDDYLFKDNLLRLPSAIDHVVSKKKIELLHAQLDQAHKDIKDSINYAKRIQGAIFPAPAKLEELFPQSFLLFRPKDVVSGDFYFLKKEKNITYIVAADCTGHGVPGAFLSIIGISKIDTLLHHHSDPAEILRRLNIRIKNTLSNSSHRDHHEGMDIAICAFDNDTNTLRYAGANRPLWILKQNAEEILEIKATKKGIGQQRKLSVDKEFTTQTIQLEKGDSFYLFTDGYADQFGGPNGKKLTSKKFKNLLVTIADQKTTEQGLYLSALHDEWRGDAEQIDDILVIGIKI